MAAAQEACTQLHANGLIPVMRAEELEDIQATTGVSGATTEILDGDVTLGGH